MRWLFHNIASFIRPCSFWNFLRLHFACTSNVYCLYSPCSGQNEAEAGFYFWTWCVHLFNTYTRVNLNTGLFAVITGIARLIGNLPIFASRNFRLTLLQYLRKSTLVLILHSPSGLTLVLFYNSFPNNVEACCSKRTILTILIEVHVGLWVACFPALTPLVRVCGFKFSLRSKADKNSLPHTKPSSKSRQSNYLLNKDIYRVPTTIREPGSYDSDIGMIGNSQELRNLGLKDLKSIKTIQIDVIHEEAPRSNVFGVYRSPSRIV